MGDALGALSDALGVDGRGALERLLPTRPPEPAAPVPRFDPDALAALFDAPYGAVRARARGFLADPAHRLDPGASTAAQRERVRALLLELADAGFGRLAYPGVTGEEGDDLGAFMAAFETLGQGELSLLVKFGVQFGLFGGSLFFLGTERHHALLPQVATGELLGCFAMSELGHGSNVMALETTATFDPETDELVIHTPSESARKEWIGNAALHGRLATVFAQLEVGGEAHGVHAVLVPIRDEAGAPMPGVRIGDCGEKLGLHGVDNGRLWFDRVRVPRANLLDRFARITEEGTYESPIASPTKRFFTMLGTLVAGRICVASGAASASQVGLAVAVRYAFARRQFGAEEGPELRLIDYPLHRRRLMPLLAQSVAARAAVARVRARYLEEHDAEDTRELEALAAGVKVFATDHATRALQAARESCGGQGYLAENRIGPLKSDTDVFTTFEGDNAVLLQLVGKALLLDFRKAFFDDRVFGVLRFLGAKASRAARGSAVRNRPDTRAELRDPETWRQLFADRRDELVEGVAMRIRKRLGEMPAEEAFLAVQTHLVAAARAHVEAEVLEAFLALVDAAGGAEREALERQCGLWTLWRLEEDAGWLLENGFLTGAGARALRDEVDALAAECADDAMGLLHALRIPDACLGAPIAFGDPAER